MIYILNVLLGANEGKVKEKSTSESLQTAEVDDLAVRRLEVTFFSVPPLFFISYFFGRNLLHLL